MFIFSKIGNIIVLTLLFLVYGCLPSLYPFYKKENIVPMPDVLEGCWKNKYISIDFLKDGTACVTEKESNAKDEIRPVFFKVNDILYVDVYMKNSLPQKYGTLKSTSFFRCHTLYKIIIGKDGKTFSVLFMNFHEILKQLKNGKMQLSYHKENQEDLILTSTPEQWENFIRLHENDPDVFPLKGIEFYKDEVINLGTSSNTEWEEPVKK